MKHKIDYIWTSLLSTTVCTQVHLWPLSWSFVNVWFLYIGFFLLHCKLERSWPLKQWLGDWPPSSSVMATQELFWLLGKKTAEGKGWTVDIRYSYVSKVRELTDLSRFWGFGSEVADSRKLTVPFQPSWPDTRTFALLGDSVFVEGERKFSFPLIDCKWDWWQLQLWVFAPYQRAGNTTVPLPEVGRVWKDTLPRKYSWNMWPNACQQCLYNVGFGQAL